MKRLTWVLTITTILAAGRASGELELTTRASLSPAGDRAVFYSAAAGGLILTAVATGKTLQISSLPGTEESIAWSPDGDRIGYLAFSEVGGRQMAVPLLYDLASGKTIPLAAPALPASPPSFSAAGELVFLSGGELIVLDRKLETKRKIKPDIPISQPAFSPRGDRVAAIGEAGEVVILNLEDGRSEVVLKGETEYQSPVWSPDQSKLAVRTITGRIQVVDLKSGEVSDLGLGYFPRWFPDSSRLLFSRVRGMISDGVEEAAVIVSDVAGKRQSAIFGGADRAGADLSRDGKAISYISAAGDLYLANLADADGEIRALSHRQLKLNLGQSE